MAYASGSMNLEFIRVIWARLIVFLCHGTKLDEDVTNFMTHIGRNSSAFAIVSLFSKSVT